MNWEQNVRKVVPYVPGEQPNKAGMIKLNTNENPYPPAPEVEGLLKEFDADKFRLYPDPEAKVLVKALADYYHVKESQVFVGVGSDDVLAMAFLTFFNSDKPILFPDITYSFYEVWADLYKIPYDKMALNDKFEIEPSDYEKENGGVIFPNPNAPTGVFMPLREVERIIEANREVVVIVDEAYIDFGGESALSLVDKYDNLLVVQTFSKSRAMAGARIGFAIGNENLIKYLNDCKFSFNSYTMSQTALAIGEASVKNDAYFKETVGKIIATRERVVGELQKLGFEFPVSSSNFVFATHKEYEATELLAMLREHDVYVRHFNADRVKNYLRITIGTDEEMDRLLELLRTYICTNC